MDIAKLVKPLDSWQQKHPLWGFPIAVIKKYGDDNGARQAAMLTYYGFLSLFPLLLVLVTILQLWFGGNPDVQKGLTSDIGHFFPLLGSQLQHQIHGLGHTGLGLVAGILITVYGARGVAGAFRLMLNIIWRIPRSERVGFPQNLVYDLAIMSAGGAGFIATAAVSAFSAQLGHSVWVKALANLLGFAVLSVVIAYVFRIGTSQRRGQRHMLGGAVLAAAVIQLLLTFGSIIVRRELSRLDSLYGTFAVVLGLLFWIYLMSQVIVFAAEVATVRKLRLYPRQLVGEKPSAALEH